MPGTLETPYAELRRSVVAECHDDYVGLWSVLWKARRVFPDFSSEQLRDVVLRLVEELLREGTVVPGFPTDDGRDFVRWAESTDAAVKRIRTEWSALGREPRLGEIVWLTTPD